MENKIKKIMSEIFEINIDNISNGLSPADIDNWDSLRHLMLIVEIEKKFEIKFTDDELISLIDYSSICKIISIKTKK
tara:strand:+ start:27002 stop:27232 length:231 start_codon:yes stop_codon:yes gene_type:complete